VIIVDSKQWPVVRTLWDGEHSVQDIERYVAEVDAIYRRRQPFVTITWLKSYSTTAEVRKRISDMMTRSQALVKQYSVCSALISNSTGFRFVLSTLFLVKRMDTPYHVCAGLPEAMTFCRREAAKRQLPLPTDVAPLTLV
jgi:hypothetical protein